MFSSFPASQSAFSAFGPPTASPGASAFPPPSAFPATSTTAFASSAFATPVRAPLKSAFGTASSAFPEAPPSATPVKSAFSAQPRPPAHLIAPKPPSKLSAGASPFEPVQLAQRSAHPAASAFSQQSAAAAADDEAEAEDDGEDEDGDDNVDGGEDPGEEAEIQRLEAERASRKVRFTSSSTRPAASSSSSSSSSTSAAKLAVARAAGMLLPDDDGGGDDGDELYEVNASTRIKGLCTSMCPPKELLDRLESHTVSPLELPPEQSTAALTLSSPVPLAIKKYRRAAAAQRLDPKDVRTPPVLVATCEHLVRAVVDRADVEWHEVHRFVTDRFRAVRSDFVCQGIVAESAVQCLEWMVRFHILAFDVLCREPKDTFDPIQNMEARYARKPTPLPLHCTSAVR